MKKKIIGICICMLMIIAVYFPAAGAMNLKEFPDNDHTMGFIPGQFIVKLKNGVTFSKSNQLMALNEQHQVCAIKKIFPSAEGTMLDDIYLLYVPFGSDILSIVSAYSSCPDVVYAEPDEIGSACRDPNDANFSIQWYLDNWGQIISENISGTCDADIDAPEAWDIETGNPHVVIAIIDSGIDYTHPDLVAKIWNNTDEIPGNGIDDDHNGFIDDVHGWDTYNNDTNITDGFGHGTMCSGVTAASTNNSVGIAGIAWGCTIMPVRVANEWGNYPVSAVGQGIAYAADNGADIVSMSFGYPTYSASLQDAVNYAYGKGVFLCAAVHNYNTSDKYYPAACANVTAVAATNQNDRRCTEEDWGPGSGSNYGDWVDIAAPGNLIFTTMPTYHVLFNEFDLPMNYSFGDGTSFSCPLVAGVAGLLLSVNSSLTPSQIETLLCGNVDPYNSTEYIGTGRLNAQKALAALLLHNLPPNPPTIIGPTRGKINVATLYNFTTTDEQGHPIYYYIDWGDGTNSGWIGLYPSGDVITQSHIWSKKGSYTIKAKAKDAYGNESIWGKLPVNMPSSFNIRFLPFCERFFARFPNLFPILRHLLGY